MPEKADFDALTDEARQHQLHILVAITPDGLIVADTLEDDLVRKHPDLGYHLAADELIAKVNEIRLERFARKYTPRPVGLAGQRSTDPDHRREYG